MRIDRELDRVFRVTITEEEALELCCVKDLTFERAKQIGTQVSVNLINYMTNACNFPHAVQPPFEVEL